jgi:hypothetical protein
MKVISATTNTTVGSSTELNEAESASDDPAGRFFVNDKGNVLAKITTVGRYTGTLFARDSVGAEVVVHTWDFEVIAPAEESFAARMGGSIAAAVLGVIIAALLLTFGGVKYHQHQIAMRPVDFSSIFNDMVEAGGITTIKSTRPTAAGAGTTGGAAAATAAATDNPRTDEETTLTITQPMRLPREIPRRCITKSEKVGEGAFGEVFKGILDETSNNNGVPGYLVACKSVTAATGDGAADLLQEATIMAQVGNHPNLVSLIGVVTSGVPLLIIIALCEHGSLKSQLEQRMLGEGKLAINPEATRPNRPPKTDAAIGVDIARGMQHLVEHNMVHRDLAARNVLLDSQLVAKVADFGLSRAFSNGGEEGKAYYKSRNGMMAIRWTAPEAMATMKFSMPTDVWSFGIVLLEIALNGELPLKEVPNYSLMVRCSLSP